ncbi:MAG: UDP-N-acetylglucosamine--dolichyl-phosphate N-acetylglucosaminephosphotransferase [Candidatus Pacearchaeota archaeon]|nr:MAG: UDP-N-acetylglucosamine--dolichyl-phosphate N-acetylglucosaminephosphotransferase [Candidatus Pacearchaeota archaeon]
MNILILFGFFLSFFIVFFSVPYWIKKMKQLGFLWEDMNKPGNPKNVAASGGIVVIISFILGVFWYIAVKTFILKEIDGINIKIFALTSVILILSIVGIIDDWFGWHSGGLSKRTRIILALFASIPLVVINAGTSIMNFPFLGNINFGIFYPLFLVPLGIVGATTTYNFLAGFNGLETGQGILILSFLSLVAYLNGHAWLAIIGLTMVSSLIGFWFYNRYPAKVFPGDSLTWSIGALIACMAILGNFEKIAVFVFIPYILETGLKLRGKLKKQSFGKPNKDKTLDLRYRKIYGLEHFSIYLMKKLKIKPTEKKVVYSIHAFQIFIIILAIIFFF